MDKLTGFVFRALGILLIVSALVKILKFSGIDLLSGEAVGNFFDTLYNNFWSNLLFSFLFFGLPGFLIARVGYFQIRSRNFLSGIIMILTGLLMIAMLAIMLVVNMNVHHLI